jgi:serine/threonine protein kinase
MIGKTISHYQILEKLGEGGMGVVYKARDTHLDRFVALKILPAEKVADPDRKRRFVQEAKAASALNHSNIITIYDIDQAEGIDFIAMEYVDGRTLDELIGRKGLKLSEALKVSVQIADALAAAHQAGIMHRDLKPGNLMVTEKGQVKVLDFGLAKLTEKLPISAEDATLTAKPDTEEGKILGTVAYMSPEQAEGKKVDARSDIFSFGSVLYEMVSGKRAFEADSKASTQGAIIRKEPEPLIGRIPHDLDKVISRCLRKDVQHRFQHMDDLKVALEELRTESDSGALEAAVPGRRGRHLRLAWAAAGLTVLAAIGLGVWFLRSKTEIPAASVRAVPLTAYPGFERDPSFSPDGSQVAFSWNGEKRDNFDIYVKLIGEGEPIRLTTDPSDDYSPAWSPDGRWIAFVRFLASGRATVLKVPALGGGQERKLLEANLGRPLYNAYLAWTKDGRWLVVPDAGDAREPGGLFLLSAESGERRRLASLPAEGPALSPDGRQVAFTVGAGLSVSDVYVLSLSEDLRPLGEPERLTFLKEAVASPVWTPDRRGIIFSSGGHLSPRRLWRIAAPPGGQASNSPKPEPVGDDSTSLAVSRNAARLAYTRCSWDADIWRIDLRRPGEPSGPPLKLIASTRIDWNMDYSPNGKKIVFASYRSGSEEIWVSNADGSIPVKLTSSGGPHTSNPRWSPDGQSILFTSLAGGMRSLWLVSPDGGAPRRLTNSSEVEGEESWSSDGKWIYFSSSRSGTSQVWKMRPGGGAPIQVTRNGGATARESPDGKFLYYAKGSPEPNTIWKVSVDGGAEIQVVEGLSYSLNFVVTEDGIYFVSASDWAGPGVLYFFDFVTKTPKRVATIKVWGLGLAISPDRRSILYAQMDQSRSELMLVENFH